MNSSTCHQCPCCQGSGQKSPLRRAEKREAVELTLEKIPALENPLQLVINRKFGLGFIQEQEFNLPYYSEDRDKNIPFIQVASSLLSFHLLAGQLERFRDAF